MDGTENTPQVTATDDRTTDDLIRQVLEEQQQHRAEVAKLRDEINAQKVPATVAPSATPLTAEDQMVARMQQIDEHSHYCPGCGKLVDYQQKCTGKAESPHPAIEVVSTDELKSGDTSKHSVPEYAL